VRYKNIADRFFGLVTKHACYGRTNGQTDRQNYDSQDRASIASRGKKSGIQIAETMTYLIKVTLYF